MVPRPQAYARAHPDPAADKAILAHLVESHPCERFRRLERGLSDYAVKGRVSRGGL